MSIVAKKYQPFISSQAQINLCDCFGEYCHLLEPADKINVQFDLTEFGGELVTNGDFATNAVWAFDPPEWTFNGATFKADADAATEFNILLQILAIQSYSYYHVKFTVSDHSAGTLVCFLGGVNIQEAPADLVYDFYVFVGAMTNTLIEFRGKAGEDFTGSVDDVSVIEMSSIGYRFEDCDTGEVLENISNGTNVEYSGTNPLAMLAFTGSKVLSEESRCYCLCVYDVAQSHEEFILDGTFDPAVDWDIYWDINNIALTGWAIGVSGMATHTASLFAGKDVLSQTLATPLNAASCYILSYDGENPCQAAAAIYYDTATETDVFLANIGSGIGITVLINNIGITVIKFIGDEQSICSDPTTIDNVSIKESVDCIPCLYNSGCIDYRLSHDCSYLIAWQNANDAFGIINEDITLGVQVYNYRVIGMIRNAKYISDNEYYTHSDGEREIVYADERKSWDFQMKQMPETVHDVLRIAFRNKLITVNNGATTFTVGIAEDSEYSPNWRKSSRLAPVTIEIEETTQNNKNTPC